MKELTFGLIRILAVIAASIAVILPWGLRCKYSALLRWGRDQLMQRSRAIRRWALHKRWSWDSHE